jgi:hypothetical protein
LNDLKFVGRWTAILCTIGLTASSLAAQGPARPAARGAPSLLADATFHPGAYEPVRVFLAKGFKYRVEFSEPGIQLEMRSYEGKALPFVLQVNYGADVSGRSVFELRPQVDGEIEFRPVFVESGRAIRFQLWDASTDHSNEPSGDPTDTLSHEFGLMVEAGSHGAYVNQLDSYGGKGSSSAACLAIRTGPGILARVWGCIAGLELATGGIGGTVPWLYMEPRVRFVGSRRPGGVRVDGGALLRLAVRATSSKLTVAQDPSGTALDGIGIYAGVQTMEAGGGGWTLVASLQAQHLSSRASGSSGADTKAFRITFGRFF